MSNNGEESCGKLRVQSGNTQTPLLPAAGADKKHHGSAVFSDKEVLFILPPLFLSLSNREKARPTWDGPFPALWGISTQETQMFQEDLW